MVLILILAMAVTACASRASEEETLGTAGDETAEESPETDAEAAVNEDAYRVIGIDLESQAYALAVDKEQEDLLDAVNEFFGKILEDGTLDAIEEKYSGSAAEVTPISSVKQAESDGSEEGEEGETAPAAEQLVVAASMDFSPFSYRVDDQDYGIDLEVAQLLSQELGRELVIKGMESDDVTESVEAHNSDLGIAAYSMSEERKEDVSFSTVYYESRLKLVASADDSTFDACQTAADVEDILQGMDETVTIGVQEGGPGQTYLENREWEVATKSFGREDQALSALESGSIQYVIIQEGM